MAGQCVYGCLGAYVPDASHRVSAGRHQDVDGGVEVQRITRRQVAVVVADHLAEHTRDMNGWYVLEKW